MDLDPEAFSAVQAEVAQLSEEALAAVRAAKRAKEEATSTTSAVATLAREEAEAAAEVAAKAAAVAEAAVDADDVTAADLRAREEKLSAAAAEKAAKAQRKAVEAQNLASFEFPEFQVPELPENATKVGGAAVVGALGVAGLAAEADLASSLMQVGGEAAMTTAFAFLFANNMVFAKDREKLMGSLESREQFEKFILSGQWMGKDSFAGEVAKEALVVFDPLGIAEETLKREKKACLLYTSPSPRDRG